MAVMTTGKKIEAEERMKRVLEMRRLGMTLEAIGTRLGISRQAVHKTLIRAIRRLHRETTLEAKAFVALELARLDSWQQTAEVVRIKGETESVRLKAVQTLIAISERRALLTGIESAAPPATSVTVNVTPPREAAEVRMAPFLAGATLDEKRQLLALMEAAEARQEARQLIGAASGPTAALMLRDAADATQGPSTGRPAAYIHTPGNHADER